MRRRMWLLLPTGLIMFWILTAGVDLAVRIYPPVSAFMGALVGACGVTTDPCPY